MNRKLAATKEMIPSDTDITLQPAPITPSWIREGKPEARNAVLSRSADGLATTFVWDCTAGKFEWIYSFDETIYFIQGSAIISDKHSPPRRFGPGDVLFLPHGTVADWHVEEYVRKVAFCRTKLPKLVEFGVRAGRKIKRIVGTERSGGMLGSYFMPVGPLPVYALGLTEILPLA